MTLGPWEIFILLLVLAVILGVGRLSQVGGAMGKSVREFRGAARDKPAPVTAPPAAAAPPVVTEPPVACPECHTANLATNRFCSACGATMAAPAAPETTPGAETATPGAAEAEDAVVDHVPVPMPTNTCPSCATLNPPGQPFCGQCGTRLKTAAA
jgi:sec-independent protein translocase protein TatA